MSCALLVASPSMACPDLVWPPEMEATKEPVPAFREAYPEFDLFPQGARDGMTGNVCVRAKVLRLNTGNDHTHPRQQLSFSFSSLHFHLVCNSNSCVSKHICTELLAMEVMLKSLA
jgi:hypothetical protein